MDVEQPIIELRGVSKSFGSQRVLDTIDLRVARGRSTVIIGRSGTGKSVLLKHIVGLLNPDTGEIDFEGRRIDHLSEKALVPIRRRMEIVSNTLKVFCAAPGSSREIDGKLLALLGEPTEVRIWLAASLDKTIRLQLDPPAELRAMSALAGPDWIRPQRSG